MLPENAMAENGMDRLRNNKIFKVSAYLVITLAVFILLTITVFRKKERRFFVYERNLMGTVVELTLMEGANFDPGAEAAFGEIKRLNALLSSYDADSDVSRASKAAGLSPVNVAPEVMEVLEAAVSVSELTNGAFDPTVGALAKVWGYSGEKVNLPEKRKIERLLPLVDYKQIALDRKNNTVFLRKKGMALNLGGVAKGYIVGKAASTLKRNGVERAIIKAGGDMYVFQKETDKRPFTVGIQDPRNKDSLIGEVHVLRGGVSTSGDYERFFVKANVKYHHILDPKTGFPANGSRSVTIIADDPSLADALSTGVFVMGFEKGMALVEGLKNIQAVIVDANGGIHASKGFKGKIY